MKQRITFLDISTMDAGDLDFSELSELGQFDHYPRSSPDQVVARLQGSEIAIVNKVVIGKAEMAACPDLKMIQVAATGTNNIDIPAAQDRGITVCNVCGYSSATVAQHTIGLLLNLATSIHRLAGESSEWCSSQIFTRLDYPATELAGKLLGIAGSGDIGSRVATIAEALGMRVQFLAREGSASRAACGRPRVAAEQFFTTSDAVSLHCPLAPETRHMINADTLGMMKRSAFLINTGRGDLVDEAALAAAIENQGIAGAGLDVLSVEPPPPDHPLIRLSTQSPGRLIITPHSAWTSREARQRLLAGMVANIKGWQDGTPENCLT